MVSINKVKNTNPWRLAKPIESTSRKITTQPYPENYFMEKSPLAKDYVPMQGSNFVKRFWNKLKSLF